MTLEPAARGAAALRSAAWVVGSAWILSLVGLLAVYAVTATRAISEGDVFSSSFINQVVRVVVCSGIVWFVGRLDYRRVADAAHLIIPAVWLGLLLVFAFGAQVKGATRWIRIGGMTLQVSELAKVAVVVAAAQFVSLRSTVMTDFRRGFLPAVAWLGVTVGLVAIEPDFGTSMFLLCLGMLLFFLGGMRLAHMAATGVIVLPVFFVAMILAFPHILPRLQGFGEKDGDTQVNRALDAIGSGGLSGHGLGVGSAHLSFVPEVRTDFIFASIAEQGGLVASLLVIGLFATLAWHGMRVARFAVDDRGYLIAFGVSFMIAFQAAINISVVTAIVPPKGISLPFVSYGGSGLLALALGLGLVVSVARVAASESGRLEEPVDEIDEGYRNVEGDDEILGSVDIARG
ncbi:MAG: FtsW/RodA/SpoVE family cell cycle protein [Planctomycetota bacterium]